MTFRRLALGAVATIAMLGIGDALQSTASAQIDELLVTVRKREENLQNVPISVTGFTSEHIRQLGIDDASRLSDFTPNFSYEKFGPRRGAQDDVNRPVIRGQSNVLGEANAAFFVDGILFSSSILSFPFQSVERIEVVRGPQAALFGRSTFAGAVNLITKRGTNEFENNLSVRAATHNDYEVNLSSSGPIIDDKLFYFVSGRYYDYGGEYRNDRDGKRVGQEQTWGFNGSLELKANDDITFIARAGFYDDDDGTAAERVQDRFANNCFLDQKRQYFCGEVEKFDSVSLLTPDELGGSNGLRREVFYGSLTAEWDINGSGWVATSNSGFHVANSDIGQDVTRLGSTFLRRIEDVEREEWSTELRLASPEDNRWRGLIGGYYYEKSNEIVYRNVLTKAVSRDLGDAEAQNIAVFGAIEWDVTESITIRGEGRYQTDEITLEPAVGDKRSVKFKTFLPRVSVNWDVSDNTMVYASWAKGNKPGIFNSDPTLPEDSQFADEEEAWNYEVGLKADLWDGRARLNLAAFYIDWSKQQLTTSTLVMGIPISFIRNVGETEIWGLEIEANAFLTEELEVGVGYGLAHGKFKENCDVTHGDQLTGFDCLTPGGVPGGDVSGNRPPNSPRHQLSAFTQYIYPLSNLDIDLFFRADYSYRTRIFSQVHNFAFIGDRHLLNLKTGFTNDRLRFAFFVDNVLDDLTPSTVVRFIDGLNRPNPEFGNANPAQNSIPGSTGTERGFLTPLADGRKFGVTIDLSF